MESEDAGGLHDRLHDWIVELMKRMEPARIGVKEGETLAAALARVLREEERQVSEGEKEAALRAKKLEVLARLRQTLGAG